jgi:hypothetical protein
MLMWMAFAAAAQTTTGGIRGVLTDNSGAVIPGANISISGNGVERTVGTQADGSYSIIGLAPGQYTVHVAFPGFGTVDRQVTVNTGSAVDVPIQLIVALEKQQVTVESEAGPSISVAPDNNATALVLKGEDLQALPDDPDDLSDALQALAGPGAGPNGGAVYIDGFTGGQIPPKESIREIRINQNPFSAEFDKLGFGRIEILTKPGTDKFRGQVFTNYSNGIFDSRNPLASNKPDYQNRQSGANFGGPINSRASFFIDFNRRDIQDNSITDAVYLNPTNLQIFPITTSVVTPRSNTTIAPRVDYQLSTNNTLTVRFEERFNGQDNSGLGRYNLPPPYSDLAYNTTSDNQNIMVTETAVLNAHTINETRFQYTRTWTQSLGNEIPQVDVANEFITGGNGLGNNTDLQHHFELQNYTSFSLGTHTVRFGGRVRRNSDLYNNPQGFNGTFTFTGGVLPVLDANNQIVPDANGNPETAFISSLAQYQRYLQLQQVGLTADQIQILGGGPSRYSVQYGVPYVSMVRWDAGPFIQDDWRVRPNLTLSMGLRYETQTLFSDHRDIAPRLGIAWAPGNPKNGRQKTVIRGGFGIFYDRINFTPFESAFLNNGTRQLDYVVDTLPPNTPSNCLQLQVQAISGPCSPSALVSGTSAQNTRYIVDSQLKPDSSLQAALGIERQLPRNTTIAVNYTFNRTNHLLQTVPINTPLPDTYNPLLPPGPNNGSFPYTYNAGNIFEYESGGFLKQNMLQFNFNTRFSRRVSLFGNYSLNFANDLPSTPSDPYNFLADYGRSNLDRRQNLFFAGSVQGPAGLRFSPFVNIRSGAPYDVLLGTDLYGDTYYNARPDFAPAGACSGGSGGNIVCTPLGNFNTNVVAGQTANLVPRNYLTMAGMVSINMRVYRVFGFGPVRGGNQAANNNGGQQGFNNGFGGGGRGGGGRGGGGGGRGGGGRGGGGGDTTEHRYNVTVGVNVTNILNHFNPGGYQGVLSSTQFGEPTTVNTGFGGGGFVGTNAAGSTANNRRVEMQLRFAF